MPEEGGKAWPDLIGMNTPICAVEYGMRELLGSCVHRYCALFLKFRATLKRTDCPSVDDHQLEPENFETAHELSGGASNLIMNIFHCARTCRWDLEQVCNSLAREVPKWNTHCDTRMDKLACYINRTTELCLQGWIGYPIDVLRLTLYVDAGFAGDLRTSKSTSGAYLCLVGPQSFFPIISVCKKQGCVSHSSAEVESYLLNMLCAAKLFLL